MGVNSLDIVGAIVMMTIIIITIVVDVIVVHICLSVPHKFSLLSTVLVCLPGSACVDLPACLDQHALTNMTCLPGLHALTNMY